LGRRERRELKKKEKEMISKLFKFKGLAIAMVLAALMSVTAFAQNVSRTLVVSRDAKIGGVVLAQGKYSIEFDGKRKARPSSPGMAAK
jgi:hypothetical protein